VDDLYYSLRIYVNGTSSLRNSQAIQSDERMSRFTKLLSG